MDNNKRTFTLCIVKNVLEFIVCASDNIDDVVLYLEKELTNQIYSFYDNGFKTNGYPVFCEVDNYTLLKVIKEYKRKQKHNENVKFRKPRLYSFDNYN